MLQLDEATTDDIPVIRALAHEIWHAHYVPIVGAGQVEYMLGEMYSPHSLRQQMVESGHRFYLMKQDERAIGYVSIASDNDADYFINKLYLQVTEQGRGIGTECLRMLEQRLQPIESIRLTVNRENYKAINFYFKNGFVIERVADVDIGGGYQMNDFVMVKRPRAQG